MRDYTLRKTAVGTALVLAAPLSLLSWILAPTSMNEGAEFVRELGDVSPGMANGALLAGSLFFPVAIIAVIGLVHLLREHESTAVTTAGGLAIVGLVLNTAALGAAIVLNEVVFSDLGNAEQVAIVDATITSPGWLLPLAGVLLAAIGFFGLGVGLFRHRTAPRVSAVALMAYGPVQLAGFGTENIPLIIASYAIMALAFVPVGLAMFTETQEMWEHPPTFSGLRPAGAVHL